MTGKTSQRPIFHSKPMIALVELAAFEFLDRLSDLMPPPRRLRHRYHGVLAPNHKLRRAVTALAIGNVGKRCEAATGGHGGDGRATGGYCDPTHATQNGGGVGAGGRQARPNVRSVASHTVQLGAYPRSRRAAVMSK